MLTEEKPEEFASPEQNHENGSKKKKKKKKKKNNETLPQSNEHPQPQVSSEPLVVTPISEFKSNQEESNEPKPSLDAIVSTELENKKEVEKIEACAEFGETGSGKIKKRKRKSKSEKGKIGDVVVVENALNHDKEQVNSIDRSKRQKCMQDGAQSNEHNVEPAETAGQISVVDREVSPVDSTIRLNNQLNSENEHNVGPAETVVQMSVIDREVSQVNSEPLVVTPISEFKSNEEAYAEFATTQTGEIKKKKRKKKKKSVINGEESNEHNVGPAETVVQISVLDREVSQVNSEPSVVTPISEFKSNEEAYAEFAKTQTGEIKMKKKRKKKKKSVINGEESNEPKPLLDATVSTEFENKKEVEKSEVYAEFAKTQTGEIKKKKKKSVINGEESNEPKPSLDAMVSTEFENKKEVEKSEVYTEFAKTQTGEIKKKRKKKKKSVINGEESNESKPSLDATVSTEFENKKEVEKSEVYAEFAKTQTGEKRKRKSESETGKMGEVVVVENVLNHDLEQVNEIDRRKRQKSVQDGAQSNEHNVEPAETAVQMSVVDREVSSVDPTIRLNNQPANLVEQKDERNISQEKHLELLKTRKIAKEEERKIRQEKHLELLKMHKIAREERKIRQEKAKEERKIRQKELIKMQKKAKEERNRLKNYFEKAGPMTRSMTMRMNQALQILEKEGRYPSEAELTILSNPLSVWDERNKNKMQTESKDELKSTGEEKTNSGDEGNKNKMQAESKDELKSTGEEKTNSGISWACPEPNHSIKQCRKLKSLSKDEEICFFCGEIGHSLGKCSVYKAGGGRLARCLFCNLHGHFSYNCPGHGYFRGAVAGGS